jgi:ubiquinone biosynthesis protein COQ9
MQDRNLPIKDAILEAALPEIPFDGWTDGILSQAAKKAGYDSAMAKAVFPKGAVSAAAHFSDWLDRRMLEKLSETDPFSLRVRDRISAAVMARFDILDSYKEAERLALALWVRPFRKMEGSRLVWKTADRIWIWAGDTSEDYNKYTKRALLSGILGSSLLYWLNDHSEGAADTKDYIERRIANVLEIGKFAARFKGAKKRV